MDAENSSPKLIRLYRYLPDAAAINTIETRGFRVSRPTDLDDAFEWSPGFKGCSPEQEEIVQSQIDKVVEDASESMGIICFSNEVEDPILWSHFTKGHRGIAFEVIGAIVSEANSSITFEVSGKRYGDLEKVENDEPRIVLDLEKFGQWTEETIKDFYKRKSGSWRYEKEYRWVMDLLKPACKPSGGRFSWEIPSDFITRVIIGFRSSVSELYVRRALELNGFQNTQVAKAKRSPTTYKVELQPGSIQHLPQ